ncbi:MAG: ADP-ribosyltransferase [Limnoraphis robusta]|uniref:ADP ribosyltransferase domain-containing protein n=1 Tax=Limnoraphis robusta CS-951 TaxID=1637645 RepID=A0A0F5YKR3_9CYAN|nr:ADP-ribosyltransferase [Limnoraphis robusta]KKD39481.1 hypothetical protein WN50_03170 [Limnoraphis robusta CS-951]KMW70506.1 hypothetical protein WN50_34695 [Limnoraphis robusta CS-951]
MNKLTSTLEPLTPEDVTRLTGIDTPVVEKIFNAISDFTTGDYRKIRRAEEQGIKDARIELLNTFMNKMSGYQGEIYRGMSFTEKSIKTFLEKIQQPEGYTLEAMASFTFSLNVAENYSGSCYSVVLRVKGNRSGVAICNFSAMYAECEVLVPKGTRYKVVNLPDKIEPGKINYIDLQEV